MHDSDTYRSVADSPGAKKQKGKRSAPVRVKKAAAGAAPVRSSRLSAPASSFSAEDLKRVVDEFDPSRKLPSDDSTVRRASSALWSRVGDDVRGIVLEAAGRDPGIRVAMALTSFTGFVVWAEKESLGLSPRELLCGPNAAALIDSYSARFERAGASRRAALRRLALAVNPNLAVSSITIGKIPLQQPYSSTEIEALLEFASSLTNSHRSSMLLAVIGLGAGAGLVRGMQRGVCKNDVHSHSDARADEVFLRNNGICRPVHPLLAPTLNALPDSDRPLIPVNAGKNYVSRISVWIDSDSLPVLSADRLRAFYAVWLLSSGRPLQNVLSILGLKKPGSLEAYLEFLPEPPEACSE